MNTRIAVTAGIALVLAIAAGPGLRAQGGPDPQGGPGPAAGAAPDELAQCLMASTTDQDKTNLVRWIFASESAHPDVADIAPVTEEQRSSASKSVAELFTRLLTENCKTQFQDARKAGGEQTLGASFGVLVQAAMRGLIENPAVAKALGGVDSHLDKSKISAAGQAQ